MTGPLCECPRDGDMNVVGVALDRCQIHGWGSVDRDLAAYRPQTTHDSFVLTLRWTCQACGWTTTMDAPGFAGDGRDHFPDGRLACGPITAQKVMR